jgi:hypothetical protein
MNKCRLGTELPDELYVDLGVLSHAMDVLVQSVLDDVDDIEASSSSCELTPPSPSSILMVLRPRSMQSLEY